MAFSSDFPFFLEERKSEPATIAPTAITTAPANALAEKFSVSPCILGIKSASVSVTIGSVEAITVTLMASAYFSAYISII